ncbi:IS1 family transposase [Candidatus Competibacter phosphatis]|uniref:IS1 family transposase n=1 Tax=Candidatus Competibacter phosphatis TaxID=221280 RepID=UPI001FE25B4F|nr:IS1 family transposase [Candidatus Competibacter phosphatis]
MKTLTMLVCPVCGSRDTTGHGRYETVHNGTRSLHACTSCGEVFSETTGTPMQGIKTPISKVAAALRLRGEGLGLRATARILGTHKNTLAEWERRFAGMKPTLMLYGLCHVFIQLTFEGDEIYTVVGQRVHPSDSTGWTAIILERASRFLVEQQCGRKDAILFKKVMRSVAMYMKRTQDTTFLSDGERRYGNALFELCAQTVRTGKRGRPRKTLPKGCRVRLKNKGSQRHRRGPKRPKYQAPQPEHPRHPARYSQGAHPRQSSGRPQRGLTAAQQCLSAQNQHLCQERRRAATHSGRASVATQLHPSTLDHRRGTGRAIGHHGDPFAP